MLMTSFHEGEYPEYANKHFPVVLPQVGLEFSKLNHLLVDEVQFAVLLELAEHSHDSVGLSDPVLEESSLCADTCLCFSPRIRGCIPKVPLPSLSKERLLSGKILEANTLTKATSVSLVGPRTFPAFSPFPGQGLLP